MTTYRGKAQTNPSTLHMDGTSPVVVHVAATTDELRALHNQEVQLCLAADPPNLPPATEVSLHLMPDGMHLTLFDIATVLDAIRAAQR